MEGEKDDFSLREVIRGFLGTSIKGGVSDFEIRDPEKKYPQISLGERETLRLTELSFSREEIASIQEQDFIWRKGASPNWRLDLELPWGKIRVVYCYGRQSIDPESYGPGGELQRTVAIPSGQGGWHWLADPFNGPREVFQSPSGIYVVGRHDVFRFVKEDEVEKVINLRLEGYPFRPEIEKLLHFEGRTFALVNKANFLHFGGFLQYRGGEWTLHPYDREWDPLGAVKEREGILSLHFQEGSVLFCPMEGFKEE